MNTTLTCQTALNATDIVIRQNKIWCDNAVLCCSQRIDDPAYNFVVGTSKTYSGQEIFATFFGVHPKFINLRIGNFWINSAKKIADWLKLKPVSVFLGRKAAKIAVRSLVQKLSEKAVTPKSITIFRDGLVSLFEPELCNPNCGSQYLSPDMETFFDEALEDAGFQVILVKCEG